MQALRRLASISLTALTVAGCAVGPDYVRPDAPLSAQFKEAPEGWLQAAPADAADKGEWWTSFNDPALNELEQRLSLSNQSIAAAMAAYEQARALVRSQRGAIFPTVDLSANATRAKSSADNVNTTGGAVRNNYQVEIGASWEIDLWGRIRRSIENARANAAVSAADLANARLSAQGELASIYWRLREADAEIELVRATVEAYRRSGQIAQNRYEVRIASKADLLQAQTQLALTEAQLAGLESQRARLEHAIAVLVGEAAGNFSLPPTAWTATIPAMPGAVPADLLQRRPDIAAAERRVAAANAAIGIQTAAFFPSLSLSGAAGVAANQLDSLFSASNYAWSVGAGAAETLFAGGSLRANVAVARAAYDAAVAAYRLTVLNALADVEDQLAALRVLERQYALREQASSAADQTEEMALNQYRAGLTSYTDVVSVQATALGARTALVQAMRDRQTTTVALIQALGGGWSAAELGKNP